MILLSTRANQAAFDPVLEGVDCSECVFTKYHHRLDICSKDNLTSIHLEPGREQHPSSEQGWLSDAGRRIVSTTKHAGQTALLVYSYVVTRSRSPSPPKSNTVYLYLFPSTNQILLIGIQCDGMLSSENPMTPFSRYFQQDMVNSASESQ